MTGKKQKNKSKSSDPSTGLRKVQRTTKRRRNKPGSSRKRGLTLEEQQILAYERLFCTPDRVVPISTFEEQHFCSIYEHEDEMLFACTGVALPDGISRHNQTRFLTSSRLVTVFSEKRNTDDRLRVDVRLPDWKTITGILGLYDQDIAIVTSVNFQQVEHVDLDLPESDATVIVAVGRAFKSCSLMATTGVRSDALDGDDHKHLAVYDCLITEAGLGGPPIDPAGNFVGVNIHCDRDTGKTWFLPSTSLRERLEHFEILTFLKWKNKNSRYESYSPPSSVSGVIPSGNTRFFKCTGFLVKCPSKCGCLRTVIVTSSSLVRTDVAEDTIDENLRIEVFLPPYQRFNGTLESYHSSYNVSIVRVKGLHCILPQDILSQQKPLREMVAAIGRHPREGSLCASLGKVTGKPKRFGWEDHGLSTCTIKKAGIGGPLINIDDGCLVGMNFYDGRTGRTPFLPWIKISEVLNLFACNWLWERSVGRDHCVIRLDKPNEMNLNRWPVPRPYWYHALLEVAGRGRILD